MPTRVSERRHRFWQSMVSKVNGVDLCGIEGQGMTGAASAAVTSWLGVSGVDLFPMEGMISQHHDCSRRPENTSSRHASHCCDLNSDTCLCRTPNQRCETTTAKRNTDDM